MMVDEDVPADVGLRPEWMSVRQVMAAVGLPRAAIYEALTAGELHGVQHCDRGTWKVRRQDFEDWQELRGMRARMLSPQQVQEVTGCGRTFVYEALQSGRLPAVKSGGTWLVTPDALDAWMHSGSARRAS